MNFYKTTAVFGVTACMLLATSAYGEPIESETFEGTMTEGSGWLASGNDAVQATLSSLINAPTPAGFPTGEASSAKVLSISGSATRTYNASASDTYVDMMVKVSIPDSALAALATGENGEAAGAQFAVAVDTDGVFKYWNSSLSTPAWVALSSTTYSADAWVRVTMKFDYTAHECTVALDGNTCGTYNLIDTASDDTASSLASVEVKGETAIDEVVVAQGSVPAFAGNEAIASGAAATKKWLTANDVTWPASADTDAIAKLNAQYIFGLAPDTSSTAATTLPLSFEQNADDATATLSFPGFGAYGGTGTYVLKSSTDKTTWTVNTVVTPSGTGVNTAQINLSELTAGTAKYYRIEASATAPSND